MVDRPVLAQAQKKRRWKLARLAAAPHISP
jgi:hypothetical protein